MLGSPQSRQSAIFHSSPDPADSLLPSERLALSISIPTSLPSGPTSTPIKKSRNDLFTLDWSSSMTPNLNTFTPPPQRPTSPAVAAPRPSWTELQQRQPEIQIVLPLTPPCANLPLLPVSALEGQLPSTPTSPVSFKSSARPLSPSISEEEGREETELATGLSTNPVLDSRQSPRLRLQPTPDFLLGEGRHASVFLASFIPTSRSASSVDSSNQSTSKWTLCAAKRVLPDRESQLAGLGEAFILSKLASNAPTTASVETFPPSHSIGASHILRLHGVKDERDGVESTGLNSLSPSRRQSGNFFPEIRSNDGAALHSRSTSDAQIGTQSRISDSPLPIHRHSSLHSQSCSHSSLPDVNSESGQEGAGVKVLILKEMRRKERGPRYSEPFSSRKAVLGVGSVLTKLKPKVLSNTGADMQSASNMSRRASGEQPAFVSETQVTPPSNPGPSAPPRIVLILEYCPFGNILGFVKSYPERMGRKRWLEWARQLVSAVVWMHSKGVLHADLKPQNVLVAQDLSLRLSDFGLSMFLPSVGSMAPAPTDPMGLGTPSYSPPEFVHPPPSSFSFPSDVFSLGVTLSVMITGREPYEGLRAVERMFFVGRGGYYEWEERRRLKVIGSEDGPGSHPPSRNGSVKSTRSTTSRTSIGEGGGIRGNRSRSDSIDSGRSFLSVNNRESGEWQRGSWETAALASRLLADDEKEDEATGLRTPSPTTLQSFLPPPSPPLFPDEDDENELEAEGKDYLPDILHPSTYPAGTPYQYFLNGIDVVPLEIRELLRQMTSPRAEERPSALSVLERLDKLNL